jgi:hypothetical protein
VKTQSALQSYEVVHTLVAAQARKAEAAQGGLPE